LDVVYKNQLMEHTRSEDATERLKSILRVLKKGGTSSVHHSPAAFRPDDISRNFNDGATSFHLKEYRVHER